MFVPTVLAKFNRSQLAVRHYYVGYMARTTYYYFYHYYYRRYLWRYVRAPSCLRFRVKTWRELIDFYPLGAEQKIFTKNLAVFDFNAFENDYEKINVVKSHCF